MSPGFIMSGGVQAIRSTGMRNCTLWRAKVFSGVATDLGPSTNCSVSHSFHTEYGDRVQIPYGYINNKHVQ